MKKGQNYNHPAKGSALRVEPIKNIADIKKIKENLKDKPMDLCLFIIGINTNMRASDILGLKSDQMIHLVPGSELVIREKKTGKRRRITVNSAICEAVDNYKKSKLFKEQVYFFHGQRGPLTVQTLSQKVKGWCKAAGLDDGNYASHSLRKTWGYHQRKTFNTPLPTLVTCFNHSNEKQTLEYLCIQPEEIQQTYLNQL